MEIIFKIDWAGCMLLFAVIVGGTYMCYKGACKNRPNNRSDK